ncbi:TIGR04222 domain-containing membrane protein [Streptomyces sp. NPDC048441]|uniref:TIGR04222 domain-containing membrane protein n=1 Tax=Streptomyces sp. NPDC048441 TaxID=3365552 RepID=UPI003722ECDD
MGVVSSCFALLIAASTVGLVVGVSRIRRAVPPGPDAQHGAVFDPLEAAFLAGGPGRVADAAIAALHEDGRLVVAYPGIVEIRSAEVRDPVEGAVLQAHAAAPSGALHSLRVGVMRSPAVQATGDALARRGLMVRPEALDRLRRWKIRHNALSFAGFFLVIGVVSVEDDNGPGWHPVSWSTILLIAAWLIGALIGQLCSRTTRARVTSTGRTALAEYRAVGAHASGAAHSVAVAGLVGVLDPGLRTQLEAAHRIRPGRTTGRSSSYASSGAGSIAWCGGGGGGGGSSCGGSGCGSSGGGCGGGSSCGGGGGSSCGGGGGSSCGGGSSGGGGGCGGGSS